MAADVSTTSWLREPGGEAATILHDSLDALLEWTGASSGWVAFMGQDNHLHVPVRRGAVSEAWLAFQQEGRPVWGLDIRGGPTLLNDLPAWPLFGESTLRNLLSCPFSQQGAFAGQIVLANKSTGFTSQDAAILQSSAHLVGKVLLGFTQRSVRRVPAAWLQLCAEHAREAILIFDHAGTLVFANEAWANWTGYAAEELCNHPGPFPFWPSHSDLAALEGQRPVLPGDPPRRPVASPPGQALQAHPGPLGYLPFRHRNHSLFWCQVETVRHVIDGRAVTVAFLRRLPDDQVDLGESAGSAISFQSLAHQLPCAVALTDRDGKVLWANRVFIQEIAPRAHVLGQPIQANFASTALLPLQRLLRDFGNLDRDSRGCLALQHSEADGSFRQLSAYWQTIALPAGPGLLFAFAEDWQALSHSGQEPSPSGRLTGSPQADCLALLLSPGGSIEFWDERWEELTGFSPSDLAGVTGETFLDWLFPQQRDRELVADLFHQPVRQGVQATLEVAGRTGGRALCCTFLPVKGLDERSWLAKLAGGSAAPTGAKAASPGAWLLLACAPHHAVGQAEEVRHYLREFTRGLSHLLNNYLTAPVGLAELALDRVDLPADIAESFKQIHESCLRAGRLVTVLQELSLETVGDKQRLSLAGWVRDFHRQFECENPQASYTLALDVLAPDALVQVNSRLLEVIVRHLLSNAVHAVAHQEQRRIDLRVYADDKEVCCEVQDSGTGLVVPDWTAVFAPFYSTKGLFARQPVDAAVEATGLGLTVSQHLAALHGGRLELRSNSQGTTAILALPRWTAARGHATSLPTTPQANLADASLGIPSAPSPGGQIR
jgi:signal transduction histidine kinase